LISSGTVGCGDIAPVILVDDWPALYSELIEQLADELTDKTKKEMFIEIIFMTYSYVHRAINSEAFPNAIELYNKTLMTGRGRGKYCYRDHIREQEAQFFREKISQNLGNAPIVYVV
jgi:spore photoproduct lyase